MKRDLAHEHDMALLRREQLRADVSLDDADLEYREMLRLCEEADEQWEQAAERVRLAAEHYSDFDLGDLTDRGG